MISSADSLIEISDLQAALEARSPKLPDLICELINQPDQAPNAPPLPENAYTFDKFLAELQTTRFKRMTLEEKSQFRQDKIQSLEAAGHEPPLPARYRCHEFILSLYESDDPYCRDMILEVLKVIPIVYGPWKAIKKIFKLAEASHDSVALGIIAARLGEYYTGIRKKTKDYMQRRSGRYYRRLAEASPVNYVDSICECLVHTQVPQEWMVKHLYGGPNRKPRYHELWKRSSRPLFSLLSQSNIHYFTGFAIERLKGDFRTELRDVDPQWVGNLLSSGGQERISQIDFAIWLLKNAPKFEQNQFKERGFHRPLLALLDSAGGRNVQDYVIAYARSHAQDMPIDQLIRLLGADSNKVGQFALDMIKARDPRKEVGIDDWGRILMTNVGFDLAKEVLRKHYTAKDLTPDWFRQFLLQPTDSHQAIQFATEYLIALHKPKSLGHEFFETLLFEALAQNYFTQFEQLSEFCLDQLKDLGVDQLSVDTLQRLLLHDRTCVQVVQWVKHGLVAPKVFGAEFLKEIAYQPTFAENQLVQTLRHEGHDIQLELFLSETVFGWLSDVRQFSPPDLGFEWLMELVQRGEVHYREFAQAVMTKAFLPADFAKLSEDKQPEPKKTKPKKKSKVDLKGQSFVFTGKLSTMTRSEAQAKVSDAKGKNSKTVGKSLDYLVIGDEGSALYGLGRKGSKQVKAESLNESDAGITIISETAFLQMLAGEQREFSGESVTEGCQRLWGWMTDRTRSKAALAQFALHYFRMHHPDICLRETDRPVDPGSEIPDSFLTFERVKPLFLESKPELRQYAMDLAKLEFARWQPSMEGLMELSDAPYPEVREFVALAMTCDDSPTHKRYRLDPSGLTPEAVYAFCESRNAQTRALGMRLLELHPRLRLPEELFRLTESPDRQVRAFVIRAFWSLYRDRGVMEDWNPERHIAKTQIGRKNKKELTAEDLVEKFGPGVPDRPAEKPADTEDIYWLLRRSLFEISPGPPPRSKSPAEQHKENVSANYGAKTVDPDEQTVATAVKRRPISARKAKLNLIETVRDFAMEDHGFAKVVLPLLEEFLESSGQSEQAACLVAVTRIKRHQRELV